MYAQPTRLDEALDLAARARPRILAGGTDVMVGAGVDLAGPVLDISRIAEIKGIAADADFVTIGAGVTWTGLLRADLPAGFAGLKAAAREVGSVQIQNRATIAGNLCNASPAADGVPPLLTLDAALEIRSSGARRHVPLQDFITGNRRTRLEPGELVTAIRIPARLAGARSSFVKLGSRRFLVISIVSAAALLRTDAAGTIDEARVAVGACSAVPMRLPPVERALLGRPLADRLAGRVDAALMAGLSPIDDVRATAEYRRDAALQVVRQAVVACVTGDAGGMA
ncbi:MAG TPA: xanthine dehydrogenase family protein subunit M [Dongiaceae bacterium]|nr:xanthine dehydrogenase family protein subunit M [Dongiaceae bacterium]